MSLSGRPVAAAFTAARRQLCAAATSRNASGRARPTGTVTAASAQKPSSSGVTSSVTRSPSRSTRPPGTPWTTSSLTEMQTVPGKFTISAGPDVAPSRAKARAASSSSAPVVTPGATAERNSASTAATSAPTRSIAACSSAVSMLIPGLLLDRAGLARGVDAQRAVGEAP